MQNRDDNSPFDPIEDRLYGSLKLPCSSCSETFETFESDPPADPMVPWARRVAGVARTKGWTVRDGACVCPTCSAKRHGSPFRRPIKFFALLVVGWLIAAMFLSVVARVFGSYEDMTSAELWITIVAIHALAIAAGFAFARAKMSSL